MIPPVLSRLARLGYLTINKKMHRKKFEKSGGIRRSLPELAACEQPTWLRRY